MSLRPKELALLEFLAMHPGRAFSREELLRHVWHDAAGNERMVDVYVFWLRAKIERDAANPVHLVTVRGSGYLFDPPTAASASRPPPQLHRTLTNRQHRVKRPTSTSLGTGSRLPIRFNCPARGDTKLLNGTRRFGALAIAAADLPRACSARHAHPTTPRPTRRRRHSAAMDAASVAPTATPPRRSTA
jgi:DNA-binding winged helix-turn-helix (wHTH) protein